MKNSPSDIRASAHAGMPSARLPSGAFIINVLCVYHITNMVLRQQNIFLHSSSPSNFILSFRYCSILFFCAENMDLFRLNMYAVIQVTAR